MLHQFLTLISEFSVNTANLLLQSNQVIPWKDGPWQSNTFMSDVMFVEGNVVKNRNVAYLDHPTLIPPTEEASGFWHSGNFGPARQEIVNATGENDYNWKYVEGNHAAMFGVLDENGTKVTLWGIGNCLEILELSTLEKISENREPANEPSNPYVQAQPENPGKMVWIVGPPGSGKSSVAKLLGRDHDFVYYELDCFSGIVNPFMNPENIEQTLPMMYQKPLKVLQISSYTSLVRLISFVYSS